MHSGRRSTERRRDARGVGRPARARTAAEPHVPARRDREAYAQGNVRIINGRIYVFGMLQACHGWTDDVKYHKRLDKRCRPSTGATPRTSNAVPLDMWHTWGSGSCRSGK